jgi:HD superfamily phosphohydrolase
MDRNSSVNQRIKEKFVNNEVSACVSGMVEYILNKSYEDNNTPFSWDDVTNYIVDNSEAIEELEQKIEEIEEQKAEEIEESEEMLENEEISEFTHERNLENIEEKYASQISKIEEKISELNDESEYQEVYEWWMVSGWLCSKLKEHGAVVLEDENIWGRCTTGQHMLLDGIISDICEELEILEGQRNEWKA